PPSAIGDQPAYLLVRPAEIVTTELGETMLPVASRVLIDDETGDFEFDITPLPDGFAYEFIFSVNAGRWTSEPRYCTVPSSGEVEYSALTDVSAPNRVDWTEPAWVAQLLALIAAGGGGGGGDGESPMLRKTSTHIQTKYPSESSW